MRFRNVLIALFIVEIIASIAVVWIYPIHARIHVNSPEISAKFRKLYESSNEFRSAVNELRRMTLRPDADFKRAKALKLFNYILTELGIPEIDPLHFAVFGKSVHRIAHRSAVKPSCACGTIGAAFNLEVVQPVEDVRNGNGLVDIYECERRVGGKLIVEVTLVFRDEDSPPASSLKDVWYDVWRLVTWGRIEDIETFFIEISGDRERVVFGGLKLVLAEGHGLRSIPPIGSGQNGFEQSAHTYIDYSINRSIHTIVVYVNTWNHALGAC